MAAILQRNEPAPLAYGRELLDSNIRLYLGIRAMNEILALDIVQVLGDLIGGAQHIRDIGGGDGLYCGLCLARNSAAAVCVLDLESGFELCAAHVEHLATGRLKLVSGDARLYEARERYDLVMINELLELFPAEEKRSIVERAVASLAPGGHIAITKFSLDAGRTSPVFGAIFSLRMLLKTSVGYLETDDEVVALLESCGCSVTRVFQVSGLKTIIVARGPQHVCDAPNAWSAADLRSSEEQPIMVSEQDGAERAELWSDLVSVATAFRASAILFAAAELGVFDRVPPHGCSAGELAPHLELPAVAARVLANSLAAMGLLTLEGGRYFVPPDLRALLASGPGSVAPALRQFRHENAVWLDLLAILRGARARKRTAQRFCRRLLDVGRARESRSGSRTRANAGRRSRCGAQCARHRRRQRTLCDGAVRGKPAAPSNTR
jgi:2-polyprenyl-3-methyl-5-hydroxy-6-metoxy-1,4-benzoquinol methylase